MNLAGALSGPRRATASRPSETRPRASPGRFAGFGAPGARWPRAAARDGVAPVGARREGEHRQLRVVRRPERELAAGRVADQRRTAVVLEREPVEVSERELQVLARPGPLPVGDSDRAVLDVPGG